AFLSTISMLPILELTLTLSKKQINWPSPDSDVPPFCAIFQERFLTPSSFVVGREGSEIATPSKAHEGASQLEHGKDHSKGWVGQGNPYASSFARGSESLFNFCKGSRDYLGTASRRARSALMRNRVSIRRAPLHRD